MVHVLCFGNPLHGDDGFGLQVHAALKPGIAGRAARLFEVGLRGIDALPLFDGCDRAILVDALDDPEEIPGTIKILHGASIPHAAEGAGHACGVSWLLQALAATHCSPPSVTLIGAVIGKVAPFSGELSPQLARQVRPVSDRILAMLPTEPANG